MEKDRDAVRAKMADRVATLDETLQRLSNGRIGTASASASAFGSTISALDASALACGP